MQPERIPEVLASLNVVVANDDSTDHFHGYRCSITWNKGKNVTVKVVKKKQKHKGRGTTRTVTKTVQNDSFFNFFSPPSGTLLTKILRES